MNTHIQDGNSSRGRRRLALLAVAFAGAASIATSQSEPRWEVEGSAPLSGLELPADGSSLERIATVDITAVTVDSMHYGHVQLEGSACLAATTAGGAARLRAVVLPDVEAADGTVAMVDLPPCPAQAPLFLDTRLPDGCAPGQDCSVPIRLSFQAVAGTDGTIRIEGAVTAFVSGWGEHTPQGAEVSVSIQP